MSPPLSVRSLPPRETNRALGGPVTRMKGD